MYIIRKRRRKEFTTTQIIAGGFMISMILGMVLLMLPISSAQGCFTNPADALFTATSAVCVTGLTTVSTAGYWSVFGQCVILVLIQIGGLGVVTFTTIILMAAAKRITLKERLLIKDAYNLNSLNGLVKLTKKILKGTFIVELIGAALYAFVFVKDYGIKGIFYSVFNSVSAFCNAGMDIIGDTSLMKYNTNTLVNTVTMILIILGGLGFPVWWDIIKGFRKKKKFSAKKMWHSYELHTKIVLSVTAILIFGGAALIMFIEYNNPDTIGNLTFFGKIRASMFQSVTTRTAGFYTVPQENFTDASAFVSLILMFIGGSPSGTAGGIKTVTVAMIILTVIAIINNRQDTEVFKRSISDQNVRKGIAVLIIDAGVLLVSMGALCITQNKDFLDTLYETVSALATVGLTRGITQTLDTVGKIIIILTMYIGRIGPISLALFFNTNKTGNAVRHYPEEDIRVG